MKSVGFLFFCLSGTFATAAVTIPLTPSLWLLEHVYGPIGHPTLVNGALTFDFPLYSSGDWVNYFDVQNSNKIDISNSSYLTMTIRVTTSGAPNFRYDSNPDNTCINPATVRPYFAVSQSNSAYNSTGRWWSDAIAYQLAAGTATLTIPLTPGSWSDVNGQAGNLSSATLSGFAATKADVREIGMTFGGGCFYGHGVSVENGTATFELLNYSIVDGAAPVTLSLAPFTLPPATAATPYSATITALGGAPPYTFAVAAGSNLPQGLSLSTAGVLSGIPVNADSYAFTLQAEDLNGATGTQPYVFSVSPEPIAGLNFAGSLPQTVAAGNWTTTFTMVASDSALVRLSLIGNHGGFLPAEFDFPQTPSSGPVLASSLDRTLAPHASLILDQIAPSGSPLVAGSAQVSATGPVQGFAIFHLFPGPQEAAAPLEVRNASSYLLSFDHTGGAALGVAVANVSAEPATVPVLIRDDTGKLIGPPGAAIALAGNGQTSFVASLQYPVTANIRGTIEFDTPFGGQISVLGIRTTPPTTPVSSGNMTVIPPLAETGTNGGSIAHIASGSGWQTTFVLVNTGGSAAQADLSFFADDGSPLLLPVSFPQASSTTTSASAVDQTIAAGATLIVQSAASSSGAAPITGSAQLTTTGSVGGFAILRYNPNGQEAMVPLETRNAAGYLLAFDNTAGTATGVALNSVSPQTVNVPVIIRDDTGTQLVTDTIPLAPNGHVAFTLVMDKYPATANIRGTIEFHAPPAAQIGVLGVRLTPAHTFTTLPALLK